MNAPLPQSAHAASIETMTRILRARDKDRDYAILNAADDTHRPAGMLSCGCAPEHDGRACTWHQHVKEALADALDIVVTYERQCMPWADYTAVRKDYDGGEPADPSGHGATEDAAVANLREQESWRQEDREARRVA